MELNEINLPPLSYKQTLTLMAMLSSNTDDEAISKCPYARSHYYRLKPQLMKYKEMYLSGFLGKSLDMLKALSPKAVQELGEELENRDVRVKNKAANDILDKVIPKKEQQTNVQVNVRPILGGTAKEVLEGYEDEQVQR